MQAVCQLETGCSEFIDFWYGKCHMRVLQCVAELSKSKEKPVVTDTVVTDLHVRFGKIYHPKRVENALDDLKDKELIAYKGAAKFIVCRKKGHDVVCVLKRLSTEQPELFRKYTRPSYSRGHSTVRL